MLVVDARVALAARGLALAFGFTLAVRGLTFVFVLALAFVLTFVFALAFGLTFVFAFVFRLDLALCLQHHVARRYEKIELWDGAHGNSKLIFEPEQVRCGTAV